MMITPNLHNACVTGIRLAPGKECCIEVISGPYEGIDHPYVLRWELAFSSVQSCSISIADERDPDLHSARELKSPTADDSDGDGASPTPTSGGCADRRFELKLSSGELRVAARGYCVNELERLFYAGQSPLAPSN